MAAVPAAGEPGSDQVGLAFRWPHGMSMSVRVTHRRQRDREQVRSAITYKVGVAEVEGGRLVSYGAYMPYLDVPGALPTEQHGMRERLASLVPGLQTDEDGGFVGLSGLERSTTARRLEAIGVKGTRRRRLVGEAVSDDALATAARRFWDQRVGRWRGHDTLVRGEEHQEPDVLEVPELGGVAVVAVTKYELVGWAKCAEDAAEARCVEIHMETTPDVEAVGAAVEAFRKARGRFGRGGLIQAVDKRTRAEIITEPRTLQPRRYKEDRFTMVRVRDRMGQERQSMTMDSQLEVYSY